MKEESKKKLANLVLVGLREKTPSNEFKTLFASIPLSEVIIRKSVGQMLIQFSSLGVEKKVCKRRFLLALIQTSCQPKDSSRAKALITNRLK